ncbi:polyprotein [Cucumis melo var. makuwa]|nr:polyprotein [Cucumis melo var. makuwa]
MTVQRDQGVGSQTVEQSRVSVVPTEGISSARQKGVVRRPRQQGKVYSITQQEAEDAPDVITGTILICNVPADVLFDPNATHSFVSSIFLTKLNRMLEPLSKGELKNAILEEAHNSGYAMHPGSTKMYITLKNTYWWPGMKQEIAEYVDRCLICQQVKPVRQRPRGFLNPLPVPEWK